MREDGPDDRPLGDLADGPPSARARAELRADLRREVADARLRFEEAGLRAETHRLLGDDRAVAEVVEEQQRVVEELERRLGRVVSAAVLQRDAEEVLAGATTSIDLDPGTPAAPSLPAAPSVPADPAPPRRVPALSGVASAVAVLAVAALAVVGVVDAPSRIDVLGAADSAQPDPSPAPGTDRPSQRPLPSVPQATGRADVGPGSVSTQEDADLDASGSHADGPTSSPTPDPDDLTDLPTDPGLEELVASLTDALRQLGDGEPSVDDQPTDEQPTEDDRPSDEATAGDDATREPSLFDDPDEESTDDGRASSTWVPGEPSTTETTTDEPTAADADDDGFVSDSAAQ